MLLIPILPLAISVGLTYFVVCTFFNRTVVSISHEFLEVKHGPLPWMGNRRIPVGEVAQLYCGIGILTRRQQAQFGMGVLSDAFPLEVKVRPRREPRSFSFEVGRQMKPVSWSIKWNVGLASNPSGSPGRLFSLCPTFCMKPSGQHGPTK